jgi:hypothetical protein
MTHPDQRYTVHSLQHADLIAEAERERQLRAAERADGGKRVAQRGPGAGRWVSGAAGALGALLVALNLLQPWSNPTIASTSARPLNRIFADELQYRPSVEEYQMLPIVPEVSALVLDRPDSAAPQNDRAPCRLVLLTGLALCAPTDGAAPRVVRAGGPR